MVDAEAGQQPTTVKLWYAAEDLRLARAVFVNRLSRPEASFTTTMNLLQERFGTRLGTVTLPWGEGEDFDGIIDLVRMKARHCNGTEAVESEIPEEYRAQAEEAHDHLCELVAEADDELMMKYLEGEETLTQEELEGLLSKAIAERIFVPVFAGDCIKEQGVNSLMDDIATYFPAPTDYGEMPLIDGDSLKISSDDDRPVAFVFKTLADPQQGRISFIKVLTGTLEPGLELVNARTRKGDRLAHLYVMCGRDMTEVGHAYAGDIIVAPKLAAETGDTLSITGKVEAAAFKFPNSQYRIAIEAENRSTVWRIAPRAWPKACRSAFRIARPSAARQAPRVATRSRPAAPVSTATAGCAWSRSLGPTARATAMSLWTRSWVAASRVR